MSRLFLEDLARRDPAAEHVVIWDQAGFHLHPDIHKLPPRVHIIPLPPYSPELNPVEIIGDLIKDRIGNTIWDSLDKLEEAIGEEVRPIYEAAARVRTLVSHDWLINQVNATATKNSAITC
jgi:transposase